MKKLLLYTTSSCHLCETAEALIEPFLKRLKLSLQRVEISTSDSLIARYGLSIPVIALEEDGGDEGEYTELAWPFDEKVFLAFISNNH